MATVASSDLCVLLQNLEALVESYQKVVRDKSRASLLETMDSEMDVLLLKIREMKKRWQVFLPFHEVIDVHFEQWANTLKELLPAFDKTEAYRPDNGFLLDLMQVPMDTIEDDLVPSVQNLCSKVDKQLASSLQQWQMTAFGEEQQELNLQRMQVKKKLECLCNELMNLHEFFSSELKEQQFRILAVRLQHRDCKQALKTAQQEVTKAHNSWPGIHVKERARMMKQATQVALLKEEKYKELADYIDLDYPELFEDACFGQFLFKNRHILSTEDVQQMVKLLEVLRLLNAYIDPTGSVRKREKAAQGRVLTEDEKGIVRTLQQLVGRLEWRGGATTDSISMGLNRMLGVGYTLDNEMQELSDNLWKLLKCRRNCSAEKSVKVTWLNIMGWCVKQRLLSGASPALCKTCYPRAGQDDYKAIDKGKNEPPTAFTKITPLLSKFMK